MEYNIKNMNIIENGQILPESEFGKNINIIISKYKPKNIVEKGTWKGLGATYWVITSLIENKYTASEIVKASGLRKSYGTEVSKGIKLTNYVILK